MRRVLLTLLAALCLAPAAHANFAWQPSAPTGLAVTPWLDWQIAVADDGEVTAVATNPQTSPYDLLLVRRTSTGQVVGPVPLDSGAYGPVLAADRSGVVHLAYQRGGEIVHATKQPAAPAFGPATVVAATPSGAGAPQLAVDDAGRVAIAWQRFVPGGARGTRAWEVAVAGPGDAFPQPVRALADAALPGDDAHRIAFAGGGELIALRTHTPYAENAEDTGFVEVSVLAAGGVAAVKRLHTERAQLCNPRIAAAPGGEAVAVWTRNELSVPNCYYDVGSVVGSLRPAGGEFGTAVAVPGGGSAGNLLAAVDRSGRAVASFSVYDGLDHNGAFVTAPGARAWSTGAGYRATPMHLVVSDAGVHAHLAPLSQELGALTASLGSDGQPADVQDVDPSCDALVRALAAAPSGRLAALLWRSSGYEIAVQEPAVAAAPNCAPKAGAPIQLPIDPPGVTTPPRPTLAVKRMRGRRVRVSIANGHAAQTWLKIRNRKPQVRTLKQAPLKTTYRLRRAAWRTLRRHGASVYASVHTSNDVVRLKRRVR